jgi:hypothetical protein
VGPIGAVHPPVRAPVRMSEARAAIERCITVSIEDAFGRDHASRTGCRVFPTPAMCFGSYAPGHDAGRVPPVPTARLHLRRDSDSPGVVFTWKVESGEPPYPILVVPRRWLTRIIAQHFETPMKATRAPRIEEMACCGLLEVGTRWCGGAAAGAG